MLLGRISNICPDRQDTAASAISISWDCKQEIAGADHFSSCSCWNPKQDFVLSPFPSALKTFWLPPAACLHFLHVFLWPGKHSTVKALRTPRRHKRGLALTQKSARIQARCFPISWAVPRCQAGPCNRPLGTWGDKTTRLHRNPTKSRGLAAQWPICFHNQRHWTLGDEAERDCHSLARPLFPPLFWGASPNSGQVSLMQVHMEVLHTPEGHKLEAKS